MLFISIRNVRYRTTQNGETFWWLAVASIQPDDVRVFSIVL